MIPNPRREQEGAGASARTDRTVPMNQDAACYCRKLWYLSYGTSVASAVIVIAARSGRGLFSVLNVIFHITILRKIDKNLNIDQKIRDFEDTL